MIGFIFLFPIEKLTCADVALLGPHAAISRALENIIFGRHLPKASPRPLPGWQISVTARLYYRLIDGRPIKGPRKDLKV